MGSEHDGKTRGRARRLARWSARRWLWGVAALLLVALLFLGWLRRDLALLARLADYQPALTSTVFDRHGVAIGEFYEERRVLTPLRELPSHVLNAFIASEDRAFYEHRGVDYRALLRAARAVLRAGGEKVQGGSTITQQVVKQLLLSPEKSYRRKVREIYLARHLEQRFSKQHILYLYLNHIYFGSGAYGIGEAARTYFGKEARELSVSEVALLAGLPQRPSSYSPYRRPEAAEARRRYVLSRMAEVGTLTPDEHAHALANPPVLAHTLQQRREERAPARYVIEEVRRRLARALGGEVVRGGGLRIETSVDAELQRAAVSALRTGIEELDRRRGWRGPERRVAEEDMRALLAELVEENELLAVAERLAREELAREAERAARDDDALLEEDASAQDALEAFAWGDDAEEEDAADAALELRAAPPDLPDAFFDAPRLGVVRAVDAEAQRALVAFGAEVEAEARLREHRWAHAATSELHNKRMREIAEVFAPGDVARFHVARVPGADAGVLRATLAQAPEAQGALLSFDLRNGDVLAMVGGYDFGQSEFNRALQAQRQPGSAFKPIVFGAAVHHGHTPATLLYDRPVVREDQSSGFVFRPENYGRRFLGPLTMTEALARSVNNATIHLFSDIGVGRVIEFAQALGIRSPLERTLGLALGASPVTLLELTRAYGVFGAGGRFVEPRLVLRVTDRHGNVLLENLPLDPELPVLRAEEAEAAQMENVEEEIASEVAEPGVEIADADIVEDNSSAEIVDAEIANDEIADADSDDEIANAENTDYKIATANADTAKTEIADGDAEEPLPEGHVMHPADAYIATSLLRAVVEHPRGTGGRARVLKRAVAAKTGTTNDNTDAWFVGFTPEVATGVWVGIDERQFLGPGETGSRVAAPIWVRYMRRALEGRELVEFDTPDGIVFARIDTRTGGLASPQSETPLFQAFRTGTEPRASDAPPEGAQPKRRLRLDF